VIAIADRCEIDLEAAFTRTMDELERLLARSHLSSEEGNET
jgi:hypothetical protein